MKKILFLLLLTSAMYGQAIAPTRVKITNNVISTTAPFLNVQETDGFINKINKTDLIDVIEVSSATALSTVGVAGKIYVTIDNGRIYRWNGTIYNEYFLFKENVSNKQNSLVADGTGIKYLTVDGARTHTTDVSNPHSVTKAQVGLGNVDNTSDLNKPISTAEQTALNLKANLSGGTFTGDVQLPSTPVNGSSAITKGYVDNALTGITWKNAVRVATTANIILSGTQTIGGVTLAVGDRVLAKNQTDATTNGIYLVSATAWTRPTDVDSSLEIETSTVAVTLGTINKNTQWTCISTNVVLGTSTINYGQISGAGTYANGTGLSLTGNVFSIEPNYTANASRTGYLSGADWSVFNGKVSGTGTTNYLSKWTGSGTVGNSSIFDNGNVGIGTSTPSSILDIYTNQDTSTLLGIRNDNTGASARAGFRISNDAYIGSSFSFFITGVNNTQVPGWTNRGILSSDSGVTGGLLIRPSEGGFQITSDGSLNNPNLFVAPTTGNVGINTNTPTEKLEVVGNIKATSYSGGATLTGVPTAPTATSGTNTTQLATTAFVLANGASKWTQTGNNIVNNNTLGTVGINTQGIDTNNITDGRLVVRGTLNVTGNGSAISVLNNAGTAQTYTIENTGGSRATSICYFTDIVASSFITLQPNKGLNGNNNGSIVLLSKDTHWQMVGRVDYSEDYSSSYTNRSMVDKGYVDKNTPKQLKDFFTDVNNVGITETDLYSYTTVANRLNATGEKIVAVYAGTFNDATASSQIKVVYAGQVIGDTGALTMSVTGAWIVNASIMRTGATTARAMVNISTPGASTASYTKYTSLTGLTFSNTNIIKITVTASGATGGDNDITASYGNILWQPAAL